MTGRDRIVLIGVVVAVVLAAAWMLVVSPERKQASQLSTEVATDQTQLASAEGKVASARAAQSQYAAAYASVVSLGKAVPPSQEVPALIDQLAQASHEKNVEFASIADGSGSSGAAGAASASAAATATASFTQLPFTFVFEGSYFDLEHLFSQLTDFATLSASNELRVNGRLLTIQSVRLAPVGSGSEAASSGAGKLTGSITATAYVLPASQGLTGTGSAASAAGTGATPASTTAAPSSSNAPAIVTVNR
jgi:Tfp pilus assembly protein PilO